MHSMTVQKKLVLIIICASHSATPGLNPRVYLNTFSGAYVWDFENAKAWNKHFYKKEVLSGAERLKNPLGEQSIQMSVKPY